MTIEDKNICHLNKNITCKYSTVCSASYKKILPSKYVIYLSKKLSYLHSENFILAKYLLDTQIKKAFLQMGDNKVLSSALECRKNLLQAFPGFNTKIIYSKEYDYGVFIFKGQRDISFDDLYPSCCTKNFSLHGGDLITPHSKFIMNAIKKSDFFCPLLKNIYIKSSGVDFNFLPFYIFCSFSCKGTIKYAQSIFDYYMYLNKGISISDLFVFLKAPFFIMDNCIINFNGYFDKNTIYYNGVFINYFGNTNKTIFKHKINFHNLFDKNGYFIIPGIKHTKISNNNIIVKYIGKK